MKGDHPIQGESIVEDEIPFEPVVFADGEPEIDVLPDVGGEPRSDDLDIDQEIPPGVSPGEVETSGGEDDRQEKLLNMSPYLVSPLATAKGDQVNMITVVVRSSGDKTRDVLRLRRIHGTVMSYPGEDRFAFQVYERGRGYIVEFPNFTTGLSNHSIVYLLFKVGSSLPRRLSIASFSS